MENKGFHLELTEIMLLLIQANFIALLQFRTQTDAVLHNFLEHVRKNAMYTSKTIQNQSIDICGDYIREKTSGPDQGILISIIADEVTETSNNHTILGVCHRMLDTSNPRHPACSKESIF